MGEEAEYLESQCDGGAERDMNRLDLERRRRIRENNRSFKSAVKREVEKQLSRHGIKPKVFRPRGKMVDRICECGCGWKFQAREADVNRGWGRFASKSCAAKFKDRKDRSNREYYGS
jgi:hypothetical protein